MSYLFKQEEIGDYRISIYQDEDADSPCTEWDMLGVYFWDYSEYGYNRGLSRGCSSSVSDAKNSEEILKELVCKYVSQKKVIEHINNDVNGNFRVRYDKGDRMWYLENLYKGNWYEHDRFSPYEIKNETAIDALCEILEEKDFASLLQDCKRIAFFEWSSRGYSQGDYVEGYAYCDKERFSKMCDTNTKNWRKRALKIFESEVKDIGLWMWGDVKGFVLEKKVPYKKVYTDVSREPKDDYEWEQIDSCSGEYYEDEDELIKDVLKENGIKVNDAA